MHEEMARGRHNTVDLSPYDAHNAQLLANAHPSDWRNPNPQNPYNLVVVGAGTAGLVTAMGAAALGARVALIERHLMGGDCLNYGCVPSQALIRCATAWADMRDAGAYGLQVNGEPGVDFSAVMRRMRRLRAAISHHDSAQRYTAAGIDVFLGTGRFTGPQRLEVEGQLLARSIHKPFSKRQAVPNRGCFTRVFNSSTRTPTFKMQNRRVPATG